MKNNEEHLGSRLKKAREAKGLTQKELSEAVGKKSVKSVSEWEQGKQTPPVDTLRLICKALGCSSDYLIHGDHLINEPPAGYELVSSKEFAKLLMQANKNLTAENERLKNNQTVTNKS